MTDAFVSVSLYCLSLVDVDASGKPGAGMLKGNMVWQGGFDECLEMTETKYCYITGVKLMNNTKLVSDIEG